MAEQRPGLSRPHPLWTIDGLGAEGPFPDFKEKLALFGQFVGDWVIEEARYPRPDGLELRSQGEIHFGWILDGRAVQDVFMTRDPDTGRAVPIGTTVRFYDPKRDAGNLSGSPRCRNSSRRSPDEKSGMKSSWRARRKTAIRRNGSSPRSQRTRSGGTPRRATTTVRRGCSPKKCGSEGEPAICRVRASVGVRRIPVRHRSAAPFLAFHRSRSPRTHPRR